MNTEEARLFYVVDTAEETREIFNTREKAESYAERTGFDYSIIISEVNNWYKQEDGSFNYDDYSNTFNDLITIKLG